MRAHPGQHWPNFVAEIVELMASRAVDCEEFLALLYIPALSNQRCKLRNQCVLFLARATASFGPKFIGARRNLQIRVRPQAMEIGWA